MLNRRKFLFYSALFAAGCSATQVTESEQTTLPDPLTFAVTDIAGLEELERDYEAFRAALAEVLQTNIEFFPVDTLFTAASALRSGDLMFAWAGPSEYVAIEARSQAQPLIVLNRPNYYTAIFAQAESGITSLADLESKTIDMWKVGGSTSHIGAVKLLLDAGLDPQTDVEILMSGEDDLALLTEGQADALARPPHKYERILKEAGASPEDFPIIAQGDNFPGDIFVVSSQIDPAVVELMQSRLLENTETLLQGIQASPEAIATKFKGSSFGAAHDADYDVVREVYQALGSKEYL
ncbi:MAG: phosphate/phosphite/phosphonate ABC transporter substrate-binding protein [Spirulinaceae cyanobacterium]